MMKLQSRVVFAVATTLALPAKVGDRFKFSFAPTLNAIGVEAWLTIRLSACRVFAMEIRNWFVLVALGASLLHLDRLWLLDRIRKSKRDAINQCPGSSIGSSIRLLI